ncbi:hypothetical protein GQ457_07G021820 [Hibiscus cannabinus]
MEHFSDLIKLVKTRACKYSKSISVTYQMTKLTRFITRTQLDSEVETAYFSELNPRHDSLVEVVISSAEDPNASSERPISVREGSGVNSEGFLEQMEGCNRVDAQRCDNLVQQLFLCGMEIFDSTVALLYQTFGLHKENQWRRCPQQRPCLHLIYHPHGSVSCFASHIPHWSEFRPKGNALVAGNRHDRKVAGVIGMGVWVDSVSLLDGYATLASVNGM